MDEETILDEHSGVRNTATVKPELAQLVIPLLKGVMYRESDPVAWQALISLQREVGDRVSDLLGAELILDDAEGYAFLRSRAGNEEDTDDASRTKIPRLIARRPLSFPVSLTLALLRKKLAEFDATGGDTRLVLTLEEIADLVRLFLPTGSNEAKLVDMIETYVNKIVDLGFLRKLKPVAGRGDSASPSYEVRRILKAFVDAQWLSDFDARLAAYRMQLGGGASEESRDA